MDEIFVLMAQRGNTYKRKPIDCWDMSYNCLMFLHPVVGDLCGFLSAIDVPTNNGLAGLFFDHELSPALCNG